MRKDASLGPARARRTRVAAEGIARRTIQVRSPRNKGFVEGMIQSLLYGCFCLKGYATRQIPSEEIQRDIDVFIAFSSPQRTH